MIIRSEFCLSGLRLAVQDAISADQIEGVQWVNTETRELGIGVIVSESVPSWAIRPSGRRFWRLVDLLTGDHFVEPRARVAWSMDAHDFGFYLTALDRWSELLAASPLRDVASLAATLSAEQRWFERHCGGRGLGREVMVLCGIGRFYNTASSFRSRLSGARFVADAFEASGCSADVKASARHAASFYGLGIDPGPAGARSGRDARPASV